jgi:uncharacterized protein
MHREYHPGELQVQRLAGVEEAARRLSGSRHAEMPQSARDFLGEQQFIVLSTANARDRPWASVLAGLPGFVHALDNRTIRIEGMPADGDPLRANLRTSPFVGLIAPDLSKRRRLRVNGRLEKHSDRAILIHVDQAYANCPKYIQRREGFQELIGTPGRLVQASAGLQPRHYDWIRRADTFFLATLSPGEGADASHRGGMPGFMKIEGRELIWPDYAGNAMFNSLGNIALHPWAGIVIPNFSTGATLQLTGRAAIDWNPDRSQTLPGAERLVRFRVEEVVELEGVFPTGLRLVEYSPFNPSFSSQGPSKR